MNLVSLGILLVPMAVLVYLLGFLWTTILTLGLICVLSRKRLLIIIQMFPRDCKFIYSMGRLIHSSKKATRQNQTVVSLFKKQLAKTPNKPIYLFEDQSWTMKDVDVYSNKIANIFLEADYKKGDVVALFMTNRPEYICIWLGLAKIGVVTALINSSLKSTSLKHCLDAAKCKSLIFSDDLEEAVTEWEDMELDKYQASGEIKNDKFMNLVEKLEKASSGPPDYHESLSYRDKLLYIYTSGTTGLPKPAVLPHSRYTLASFAMICLMNLRDDDIVYDPLPLYHTAGGALGAGIGLTNGYTVVLRKKFSASSYIADCIKYKATIGQYIGEMCRYMLATTPKPEDTQHCLRKMIGNGLRPAIWSAFSRRFKVNAIVEIYGATEGNVNIANLDGTIGAVGSLPQCLPSSLFPVMIVKIDQETKEPIRDKNGMCIPCKPNEPGMFVGQIKANDPSREFHGYVDEKASKKKVWKDVFHKGDTAFVSGDLMVMDEYGYIFFKDRTGDTFRWKGENVATSEVEAVVSAVAGLKDCTVYGVQVGELEGKAGMAAVVDPANELDMPKFALALDKALPQYARPLFLRVLSAMELTGTFKLMKNRLQQQGFDPETVQDKLYFRQGPTYIPLDKHLYTSIVSGDTKL